MPETATASERPADTADARLAELARAVAHRQQAFRAAVEARVLQPWRAALAEAAQAHAAAAADLAAEGAVPDAAAAWQRLEAYREAVHAGVLDPLREMLETLEAGRQIEAAWEALQADLQALAGTMPEVLRRPEPPALYGPAPGDPLVRRLRKAVVRVQRRRRVLARRVGNIARRLVRSAPVPAPPYVQQVPLRRLAAYHLRVRLPHAQAAVLAELLQHVAHTVAGLEHILTAWTYGVLDADRPLDEAAWAQVRTHADRLGAWLLARAEQPVPELDARLASVAAAAGEALQQDVDRAGSFMLDAHVHRSTDAPVDPPVVRRLPQWTRWHRQAVGRLDLDARLLQMRAWLLAFEAEQAAALRQTAVAPAQALLDEAVRRLQTCREAAEQSFEGAEPEGALRAAQERLLAEALTVVEDEVLAVLGRGAYRDEVRAAAEAGAERLLAFLRGLPAGVQVHPLPPAEAAEVVPDDAGREVRLREFAEQAFDALLVERIRRAAGPAVEALAHVEADVAQVPAILRFNLEQALAELQAPEDASDRSAQPRAAARAFMAHGLERSMRALETTAGPLADVPEACRAAVAEACTRGWGRLFERVRQEGRMQEQLLDLRTRLNAGLQAATGRAATYLQTGRQTAARTFRLGHRRARTLVRIGQSAVGGMQASEQERLRTLEALAGTGALLERFPLVYRRLFAFQPVTDPALLENREADLAFVQRHYARWQQALSGALVLTAEYGGGLTSLLNVAEGTVWGEATVRRLELAERLDTEDALVRRLAEVLGGTLPEAEGAPTLDGLAEHLWQRPAPATPEVCLIEHLEHLLLRVVGGTNLAARLLGFMSRTDTRVLWVTTITEYGWHVLARTEAVAASLVTRHALAPFGRPALERLILNRHQRSGLPLFFEAPADPRPLLRRRLRRTRQAADRQQLLRQDYFDRLFRAGGQNILLALFYWLSSVTLDTDEAVLHVRPVQPLSFAFLGTFPLSHAFTLKAFLEHGTLTLDEHSRIFRCGAAESFQVFESLYNHLLIEPAGASAPGASFEKRAIEAAGRYRLRPLVVYPVVQYLRGKHIVY